MDVKIKKITKLRSSYFQKSKFFLYPMLRIPRIISPTKTYLFWEDKYGRKDYRLICEYKNFTIDTDRVIEKKNLFAHSMYDNFYETDDTLIYVFNLVKHKEILDIFIEGKYSQIPKAYKNAILAYYDQDLGTRPYMESFLYPDLHFDTYSDLLNVDIDIIKTTGELSNKPNLKFETFNKPIKNLESLFIK